MIARCGRLRGRDPYPLGSVPSSPTARMLARSMRPFRAADTRWDLVVDCIGYTADDARQDVATFTRDLAGHLVFISTDFVYSPVDRPWRVDETYDRFETTLPYGRQKREAEEVLLKAGRATRRDPADHDPAAVPHLRARLATRLPAAART